MPSNKGEAIKNSSYIAHRHAEEVSVSALSFFSFSNIHLVVAALRVSFFSHLCSFVFSLEGCKSLLREKEKERKRRRLGQRGFGQSVNMQQLQWKWEGKREKKVFHIFTLYTMPGVAKIIDKFIVIRRNSKARVKGTKTLEIFRAEHLLD